MRGKRYWEERSLQNLLATENSELEFEKNLQKAYDIALVNIKKELDAFYQKYATNGKMTYAEARKRLTPKERKPLMALFEEWYDFAVNHINDYDYSQQLKKLSSQVYVSRLQALEESIIYEIKKLKYKQQLNMRDQLHDTFTFSYYDTTFNIAKGVSFGIPFVPLDTKLIERAVNEKWDGQNYKTSIWGDTQKLTRQLKIILPQAFSRGLNVNIIGDMIAKEMNVSYKRARALARTEVNYISNQGTLSSYKAGGIEKYEFLAVLDSRTSDLCRSHDGNVYNVADAKIYVNYPPLHVNCRSTTVPVFEDKFIEENEMRIAKDFDDNIIYVPRRMTQEQWVKQFVPANQQEKFLKFKNKYKKSA